MSTQSPQISQQDQPARHKKAGEGAAPKAIDPAAGSGADPVADPVVDKDAKDGARKAAGWTLGLTVRLRALIERARVLWRILFALLLVIVTYLTVTPNPEEVDAGFALTRYLSEVMFGDAAYSDKVGHFIAYGTLGASAYLTQIAFFGRRWLIALGLCVYGAMLEGVQGQLAARSAELADGLANAGGAVIGFAAMAFVVRLIILRTENL